MKLLMLYTHDYWLQPYEKNLAAAPDVDEGISMKECIVALIHVEPQDLETRGKTTTKALKQLKWLARKSETQNIVLHSFAHLASESAAADPCPPPRTQGLWSQEIRPPRGCAPRASPPEVLPPQVPIQRGSQPINFSHVLRVDVHACRTNISMQGGTDIIYLQII